MLCNHVRSSTHLDGLRDWALSLEEIPDGSEDQPHGVADQGSYHNEHHCRADVERADDVQGFDKMHPQNKVYDGLSETKGNY